MPNYSLACQLRAAAANLEASTGVAASDHWRAHYDLDGADDIAAEFRRQARACKRAAFLVESGVPDPHGVAARILADADRLIADFLADFSLVGMSA